MPKVLVATHKGQGGRDNDFCWTDEGEVVYLGFECTNERIDGGCGCRRSFAGTSTQLATTTAEVISITDEQMREIADNLAAFFREDWKANEVNAKSIANAALAVHNRIQKYPVGTIIERRGRALRERKES